MAFDDNLVLASAVDISADANQSDVALPGALKGGNIVQFYMHFAAITGTDPTLDLKIQEKVGSNYRDVAKFPQAGSALDTEAGLESGAGHLCAFGRFSHNATHYRYVADVGGTTPVFNDVTIRAVPLFHRGYP